MSGALTEMPGFVAPMLARLSTMPTDQSRWAFEVKWDGVRAIARCRSGRVQLLTRNGNDVSAAYPELQELAAALGPREAILDGEIVAFDQRGRPSFQGLQERMHLRSAAAARSRAAAAPVTYLIFDLLWLDGHTLMEMPYEQRRERLLEMKLEAERWRTPAHHVGQGDALLAATREHELEGVVAKRLDSPYRPGRREGSWLKIKNHQRQELVIGGWTEGKGSRSARFGALELGVYDDRGELRHAGKVGTGFDEHELDRLMALLAPLTQERSPFSGRQPARGTHFVAPELVCEVEFSEWTRDGRLRQASYRGLREDKPAVEVVRERVQPPPEPRGQPAPPEAPELAVQPEPARPPAEPEPPEPPGLAEPVSKPAPGAGGRAALVQSGRSVRGGVEVELEGRTLKLTNLDKPLYPAAGFTKGQLIDWQIAIAPALLPHLRDRPLTLKRYPDGVEGKHFYEKQSPRHRPEWVQTVGLPSERSGREVRYTLCQDLPTLLWLANLADIELHPSLSKAQAIDRPTALVFDLDPGAPAGLVDCCQVALWLRELFDQLGLRAFAKTSGLKGMQVYVPLNDANATYAQTKPFAHAVANLLHSRHPDEVIAVIGKAERQGRVLIDWSQNDEHKTTVSVYSLRAAARPTVSTPVGWEEVQTCLRRGEESLLRFETAEVLARVAANGDLFSEVLSARQSLPRLDPGGG